VISVVRRGRERERELKNERGKGRSNVVEKSEMNWDCYLFEGYIGERERERRKGCDTIRGERSKDML
jgi:hypothetical protein